LTNFIHNICKMYPRCVNSICKGHITKVLALKVQCGNINKKDAVLLVNNLLG